MVFLRVMLRILLRFLPVARTNAAFATHTSLILHNVLLNANVKQGLWRLRHDRWAAASGLGRRLPEY